MAAVSSFRFATFSIANQIFFQSKLSLGIVNLKPLVPGHVLVIPKRVSARFTDLTTEEVSDMFLSVQQIARALEKYYNTGSMTISCQDGPLAGQTVPHTHIHLLPRQAGDFEPLDSVYDAMENNDINRAQSDLAATTETRRAIEKGDPTERKKVMVDDESRVPRGAEAMKKEARLLSELFPIECRVSAEE